MSDRRYSPFATASMSADIATESLLPPTMDLHRAIPVGLTRASQFQDDRGIAFAAHTPPIDNVPKSRKQQKQNIKKMQ